MDIEPNKFTERVKNLLKNTNKGVNLSLLVLKSLSNTMNNMPKFNEYFEKLDIIVPKYEYDNINDLNNNKLVKEAIFINYLANSEMIDKAYEIYNILYYFSGIAYNKSNLIDIDYKIEFYKININIEQYLENNNYDIIYDLILAIKDIRFDIIDLIFDKLNDINHITNIINTMISCNNIYANDSLYEYIVNPLFFEPFYWKYPNMAILFVNNWKIFRTCMEQNKELFKEDNNNCLKSVFITFNNEYYKYYNSKKKFIDKFNIDDIELIEKYLQEPLIEE